MTAAEPSTTHPPAGHPTSAGAPVPHEAKGLFPRLTDDGADALRDVMTAVNGFYYPGDRSDAIASAVAWLQEHPQACAALGLGPEPGLAAADAPRSAGPLGHQAGEQQTLEEVIERLRNRKGYNMAYVYEGEIDAVLDALDVARHKAEAAADASPAEEATA